MNLVSALHVDVPFHNDAEIGVVEHVFAADAERAVEEFAAELYSERISTHGASVSEPGSVSGLGGTTAPEVVACTV